MIIKRELYVFCNCLKQNLSGQKALKLTLPQRKSFEAWSWILIAELEICLDNISVGVGSILFSLCYLVFVQQDVCLWLVLKGRTFL